MAENWDGTEQSPEGSGGDPSADENGVGYFQFTHPCLGGSIV